MPKLACQSNQLQLVAAAGRLDADLASGLHEPEPTVISAFHLTRRIEVDGGHTRSIRAPPGFHPQPGHLLPPLRTYTPQIPLRGYDVSRLRHDAGGCAS